MTRDEIIEMAREAGFRTGRIDLAVGDPIQFVAPVSSTSCTAEVLRFALLVAAKEREECAKECYVIGYQENAMGDGHGHIAQKCGDTIRARENATV